MAYSAIKIANRFRVLSGGNLTPLQLIKLVYIAHGWSFAKFDMPLINEEVQAWQYGPVIPQLYRKIKMYKANPVNEEIKGDYDESNIEESHDELIKAVYKTYGALSGGQLSSLTHKPNSPWYIAWNVDGEFSPIKSEIITSHYKELDKKNVTNL